MYNNNTCVEAKQKKQEYGGGKVNIKNLYCKGNTIFSDPNSLIKVEKYDF